MCALRNASSSCLGSSWQAVGAATCEEYEGGANTDLPYGPPKSPSCDPSQSSYLVKVAHSRALALDTKSDGTLPGWRAKCSDSDRKVVSGRDHSAS